MTIRACVYASIALAWLPAAALGATVQASISGAASPPAGSTVQVVCSAEGRNPSGMTGGETMQHVDVAVSGGALAATRIAGPAVQSTTCSGGLPSCNVIQGSVSWTTPPDPATLTATCTATYLGGFTGSTVYTASSSATLITGAAGPLPPVASPVAGPGQVVAGTAAGFSVAASDPNLPPQQLGYAWTASGGTLTTDSSNPAAVSWLAPATGGTYQLTVTVSNGAASSVSTAAVTVVLAAHQGELPVPLVAPRRISQGDGGGLFVVDGDQGVLGRVALLDPAGGLRGFASLPEPALALTQGAGFLWVTTAKGSLYRVDTASGRTLGKVALAGGRFSRPSGIAFDAANRALWVADTDAGCVRVIRPDGATVAVIDAAGGAPLAAPLDVAIDPLAGRAWLLAGAAKKALVPGEPVAAGSFVHAFALASRQYLGSYVRNGTAAGQVTRAGGLVFAGGRLYVSDIFQGTVQVLGPDGSSLGTVGTFGQGPGQLMNPMGLATLANGDLAVTNASLGRIDRFGNGAALPTCAGAACLAGVWAPIRSGPTSPAPGSPGRGHGHGHRHGNGDGDGDRDDRDAAEGAGGAPVVVATGPARSPPGLVRLAAVASGRGGCAFRWTQAGGPAVKLGAASAASPSFVARAVASYVFDVVATCGGVASAPSRVAVVIENRPPLADAGRVVVLQPGAQLRLDASFSSDANGDPLTFSWEQVLGKPIIGVEHGAAVVAAPPSAGLYAFQLTVSDGRGAQTTAEVPVVVASDAAPVITVSVRTREPRAGARVVLGASASRTEGLAAFNWTQVAGPAVALDGAGQGASFVPPVPGRYRFEVSAAAAGVRSTPARVDVYVAPADGALPTVAVTVPPEVVAVGIPVPLDARGSGSALRYAWRQVAGPAAGLTSDDAASATAVAFVPGFYVFEVAVRDGEAESRPARIAFEARAGGKAIPRARVAVPRPHAMVGELVLLDGRASSGAARWRWTQVEGPWVVLGGADGVAWFRSPEPGVYAFELEVDDGATRSAPARVSIEVTEEE